MQDFKNLKRQTVLLDVIPFVFNVTALISFALYLLYGVSFLCNFFGFSLSVCILLHLLSHFNNYCIWHKVPIYNLYMMVLSSILFDIDATLLADSRLPILHIMFWTWVFLFLLSALFFVRARIHKMYRRCT